MNHSDRYPYAVQWHEGMLLAPEHFQQTDRRTEQLFGLYLKTYVPYFWGIQALEIDRNRLASGVFHVMSMKAVLPDGTLVVKMPQDEENLELNLKALSFQDGSCTIHIGLTKYIEGTSHLLGSLPRFRSVESLLCVDENTGLEQRRYPMLKPNLVLLPESQLTTNLESFPLAKVNYVNGAYSLSTTFIPPLVTLDKENLLTKRSLNLCAEMRQKIAFISERLHHQVSDIMTQEALHAVNTLGACVVPLEAFIYSQPMRPHSLYLLLVRIAGEVSKLDQETIPPLFKPYHHDDLRQSFEPVFNYIQDVLSQIEEGYYVMPFKLNERLFTLPLKPSYLDSQFILGAKASKTMTAEELRTWIQTAVIATENQVTSVRDKRILGANRQIIQSHREMQLMAPKDVTLFSVENDASFIEPGGTLCLFNISDNADKRPLEVVLYLPKEKI